MTCAGCSKSAKQVQQLSLQLPVSTHPAASVHDVPHSMSWHVQAAAEVQEFVQEIKRCDKLPYGRKPSLHEWRNSQHAHRIQALQAFALETSTPPENALAIELIQVHSMHWF